MVPRQGDGYTGAPFPKGSSDQPEVGQMSWPNEPAEAACRKDFASVVLAREKREIDCWQCSTRQRGHPAARVTGPGEVVAWSTLAKERARMGRSPQGRRA